MTLLQTTWQKFLQKIRYALRWKIWETPQLILRYWYCWYWGTYEWYQQTKQRIETRRKQTASNYKASAAQLQRLREMFSMATINPFWWKVKTTIRAWWIIEDSLPFQYMIQQRRRCKKNATQWKFHHNVNLVCSRQLPQRQLNCTVVPFLVLQP